MGPDIEMGRHAKPFYPKFDRTPVFLSEILVL
jgi:hypothetical protein